MRAVYASEKFFFRDLFRKYELRLDHSRASISFSNPVSHVTSDTENSICCLELRRAPTTFLKVFLIANSFANMIDSFFLAHYQHVLIKLRISIEKLENVAFFMILVTLVALMLILGETFDPHEMIRTMNE